MGGGWAGGARSGWVGRREGGARLSPPATDGCDVGTPTEGGARRAPHRHPRALLRPRTRARHANQQAEPLQRRAAFAAQRTFSHNCLTSSSDSFSRVISCAIWALSPPISPRRSIATAARRRRAPYGLARRGGRPKKQRGQSRAGHAIVAAQESSVGTGQSRPRPHASLRKQRAPSPSRLRADRRGGSHPVY